MGERGTEGTVVPSTAVARPARTVLTYGSFDLFHIGHLNVFRRLERLGDKIIVGVSTDEFNAAKGKQSIIPFVHRIEIVRALRMVDLALPEQTWEQKRSDIAEHKVDVFAIGEDWRGHFDDLSDVCEVIYLQRTVGVSSTHLRSGFSSLNREALSDLQRTLASVAPVLEALGD